MSTVCGIAPNQCSQSCSPSLRQWGRGGRRGRGTRRPFPCRIGQGCGSAFSTTHGTRRPSLGYCCISRRANPEPRSGARLSFGRGKARTEAMLPACPTVRESGLLLLARRRSRDGCCTRPVTWLLRPWILRENRLNTARYNHRHKHDKRHRVHLTEQLEIRMQ